MLSKTLFVGCLFIPFLSITTNAEDTKKGDVLAETLGGLVAQVEEQMGGMSAQAEAIRTAIDNSDNSEQLIDDMYNTVIQITQTVGDIEYTVNELQKWESLLTPPPTPAEE